MKLNDPFGRLERRHQITYEAVRDSLRRNGVDTPAAARAIIRTTRIRAFMFLAAIGVLVVFVRLLAPAAFPVTCALALLAGGWVINWTINGARYLRRYVSEELGGERD